MMKKMKKKNIHGRVWKSNKPKYKWKIIQINGRVKNPKIK